MFSLDTSTILIWHKSLTISQRNPDGTFKAGSKLAHDLGVQGGHASHSNGSTGGAAEDDGRNPDGTFKAGSKLAHDLGAQGGHAAHQS